jgi:general stress protein 26
MENQALADEVAAAFLEANTICVLSTLMQDGSPYASVAHFAVDGQAHALYMSLDIRSQTAQNLLIDSRAAITIGHDPAVPATLQMRGQATIMPSAQLAAAHGTFYARFPHSCLYRDDPNTRFVYFRPTWSRYADVTSKKEFFMRGFAPQLLRRVG